jgi:hypothetical protein
MEVIYASETSSSFSELYGVTTQKTVLFKNIRDSYNSSNEFKKGYQPKMNVITD